MPEPKFELYRKDREEVPTVDESIDDPDKFDPTDVEPDREVRGYNALSELLDESEEQDGPGYRWREVDVESAPEQEICSRCDATIRTHSDERLEAVRSTHHVSTGH